MAHSRMCNYRVLRLVLVWGCACLAGVILGAPLFWHLKEHSAAQTSCPSCVCDCSPKATISMPLGEALLQFQLTVYIISLVTLKDCDKLKANTNDEMGKGIIDLLSEELSLQQNVIKDELEHTEALIMDAKKNSLHYQKEAEKCNAAVETCEGARQRAEAALTEESKLLALWEKRARECGWEDDRIQNI
ncbi:uncharacterized protein LOC131153942 [Malania oleifera]|uniref:uncharacterized protein LOC131153942 n=1 Tax=Malania oleifera TaxID=397392 RepID=UPI0025AE8437|nr:uncharacterized protein LOC131153942 [Malania oleifera]